MLTGFYSFKGYETPPRRIRFKDPETDKTLVFLTNNFALPALTVTELYWCRWQVELFFKWIKQHLRIKSFFGTTENAVRTQIWIAVPVYVLVAIVKKRLNLIANLYEMLQILSPTMLKKPLCIRYFRKPSATRFNPLAITSCFCSSKRWDTTVIVTEASRSDDTKAVYERVQIRCSESGY